jgi:hypothetical protein
MRTAQPRVDGREGRVVQAQRREDPLPQLRLDPLAGRLLDDEPSASSSRA